MKKVLSFALALVMCLSLCACGPNKETQDVIGKIDTLTAGEITLESESLILEIDTAYQTLSEKEKEFVSNIAAFDEAKARFEFVKKNEDILAELDENISKLGKLRAESVTEIDTAVEKINRQYGKLDDEFKEKATKYDELEKYIADAVVTSVKALTKDSQTVLPSAILKGYGEYLSDSQKLSCLGNLGKASCVNDVISDLKRRNSDKTFSISNVRISSGNKFVEGENVVEGKITAYVTNVFGGGMSQTLDMYYTFDIDLENCVVTGVSGFSY